MNKNYSKTKICFNILAFCAILIFAHTSSLAWHIPETGQDLCYDNAGEITCPDSGSAFNGQDGNYFINPPSYTKLDSSGAELPSDASSWAMVRDNVTGLIWEVKKSKDGQTDYADPHDADNYYTWFDNDSETNGGDVGTAGDLNDTKDFISSLNNERFGGFDDWRLPTVLEIASIIDYGRYGPAVDPAFFPNIMPAGYWSSVTHASNPSYAWRIDLGSGIDDYFPKANSYYAFAVRGGKTANAFVTNGDGTVTDSSTGLVWAQYPAKGGSGNSQTMTWQEALSDCEASMLGGFPDWRLPTIKELLSIADYSKTGPVIDESAFPATPGSLFWTGTTAAADPAGAWHVDFGSGGSSYWVQKTSALYVRAMRGGKAPVPDAGSLTVNIEPTAARNSGGQWRRLGSSEWHDSGYIEAGLPVGTYLVEFNEPAGWVPPQALSVEVVKDQQAEATGTYSQMQYSVFYVAKDDPDCGGKSPCFAEITQAMAEPGNAKMIKIAEGDYAEHIHADKNESHIFQGGYNASFSKVVSFSSVSDISITNGNLILEKVQIGSPSIASQAASPGQVYGESLSESAVSTSTVVTPSFSEELLASARPGSPEKALLNSLGRDVEAIFSGCTSPRSSGFPVDVLLDLYEHSLWRSPYPWAIKMWLCYTDYLTAKIGADESQVIWYITTFIFESEEYWQRKRNPDQTIEDLYAGLLSRRPSADERATWLNGDWTFRQAVFALTRGSEFKGVMAERWAIEIAKTNRREFINLYIGLVDRFPTNEELDLFEAEFGLRFDFIGFQESLNGYIMMSDEFKKLEPTERGANLRLGLTLIGPDFDALYLMPPER